jgi:hypothetical protein
MRTQCIYTLRRITRDDKVKAEKERYNVLLKDLHPNNPQRIADFLKLDNAKRLEELAAMEKNFEERRIALQTERDKIDYKPLAAKVSRRDFNIICSKSDLMWKRS